MHRSRAVDSAGDMLNSGSVTGSAAAPAVQAPERHMLKLLGSYAIAKLLGGGFMLAIVIYLLLTALGR